MIITHYTIRGCSSQSDFVNYGCKNLDYFGKWDVAPFHHQRAPILKLKFLPGYGTLPFVASSVSSTPKDQTSDLMVKRPYRAASGAVHLMGNLAPAWALEWSRSFHSSASEVTMAREETPYPVSQCTRCLRWVSPDRSRPLYTPGCLRPGCWRRAGPCGRSSSSPRRPCLPRSNERGWPLAFFGKTNICLWFQRCWGSSFTWEAMSTSWGRRSIFPASPFRKSNKLPVRATFFGYLFRCGCNQINKI